MSENIQQLVKDVLDFKDGKGGDRNNLIERVCNAISEKYGAGNATCSRNAAHIPTDIDSSIRTSLIDRMKMMIGASRHVDR